MIITFKKDPKDPDYPIMSGNTPVAKEFNKRQEKLWKEGRFKEYDFQQIATVLLEIFCDEFDKRHTSRKKRVKKEEVKETSKE